MVVGLSVTELMEASPEPGSGTVMHVIARLATGSDAVSMMMCHAPPARDRASPNSSSFSRYRCLPLTHCTCQVLRCRYCG